MVSVQQLNIVLGFSAAYFSNYYLLGLSKSGLDWVQSLQMDTEIWRWMLGMEFFPACLFFLAMFFVPESPRWLLMKGMSQKAEIILTRLYQSTLEATTALRNIKNSLQGQAPKHSLKALFTPKLRLVLWVGIVIGILQQITGVNAIYFYATTIFEHSGIGKDAAFAQAVWVGIINVLFTLISMSLIDRIGRRPLLLIGVAGVAISMFITAYGFYQATYKLEAQHLTTLDNNVITQQLSPLQDQVFNSDLSFKQALRQQLGEENFLKYEGAIVKQAITINPTLVLAGILGFVACFAFSLGPVMWVLLSELFPNQVRGIAISFIGLLNSAVSFLVQLIFPWELSHLGNTSAYAIFGILAVIGFFLLFRTLPETKGKSLEEIEEELVA